MTRLRVFTEQQHALERWARARGVNPGGVTRLDSLSSLRGMPRGTEVHLVHPFMGHPLYRELLMMANYGGFVLIQED